MSVPKDIQFPIARDIYALVIRFNCDILTVICISFCIRSVTEVKPNEDYSVGFLSDGRQFQLDVHLGTTFPNEKPRISISPRVRHDWVNEQTGDIHGAPGLVNVSQAQSINNNRIQLNISRTIIFFLITVHRPFRSGSRGAGHHSSVRTISAATAIRCRTQQHQSDWAKSIATRHSIQHT